jgi:transposase
LALRSRIVLACADGRPNTKIADELGCDRVTVGKWRHRFAAERLEGLVDAPRPGAARTISDEVVEAGPYDDVRRRSSPKGKGYASGADWAPWSLRTGDEVL